MPKESLGNPLGIPSDFSGETQGNPEGILGNPQGILRESRGNPEGKSEGRPWKDDRNFKDPSLKAF